MAWEVQGIAWQSQVRRRREVSQGCQWPTGLEVMQSADDFREDDLAIWAKALAKALPQLPW